MKNAAMDIDYSDLSWGKYNNPMAHYLSLTSMGGDEDEYVSNGMGDGAMRYGRRLLLWDDQGFVACETYDDADAASAQFAVIVREYTYQCEKCGEDVGTCYEDQYEHDRYDCHPWSTDSPDIGRALSVRQYEGVAFRLDAVGDVDKTLGKIQAHMVGDDRTFELDSEDFFIIADEDYCHECGQIGCTANGR